VHTIFKKKIDAKTLEYPGLCSVLGEGHHPRTVGRGRGRGPYFCLYKVGRYTISSSYQNYRVYSCKANGLREFENCLI